MLRAKIVVQGIALTWTMEKMKQSRSALKGRSTDFTHEVQFTLHLEWNSACEKRCIMSLMSSVALGGEKCYKAALWEM